MTIEGTPKLTAENQNFWKSTYAAQRKDRMQDAIDDYLQDHDISPRQTYEEMLSCVQDVIDYHKKCLDRALDLKSFMMGHREIENIEELSEKWKYEEIPARF